MEHKLQLAGHIVSWSALVGYFLSFLPKAALVLTIVWTVIQIYESKTYKKVEKWFVALMRRLMT